ncbi:hypothetical protein [Pseudoxanthomonas kaohsiungensis]|uniref:ParB/Spo0J HTH domain-containing protein n=1 Tax=Pseudoxanthomonas kaohsiungensis TaxID=283923 RepID=A0ABW3LZC2_9GAMM|nr:hypothetical protein [Pseudoxanthomonas kaohsiungensis]KAF1702844.1 hypothetical protein CSC66_08710 [Pseudoxanthomonas kaohsiungensis]
MKDDGNGGNEIVAYDGGTRLEAVLLAIAEGAKIPVIPVFLAPKTMSLDDILKAQVKNNNGTPFSMLETALIVKRLENRGHTAQEIAEEFNLTLTHVDNLMVLASAPKMIHNMIISNQVAATMAVGLIRKEGPEKAAELLQAQLKAAQAQGKTKITPKSMPDAKFNSGVRAKAPAIYERLSLVRQDPGYGELSEENRAELDRLWADLQALRQLTH